jgi:hypothetical protein
MRTGRWLRCALGIGLSVWGLSSATAQQGAASPPPAVHDGQHDFDFNFGAWKTHIHRLKEPFTGSTDYLEMHGTVTVRKVWDGRAQLEEIEVDGPAGHWQGMTLFLYDPKAHQWSQTFINSAAGTFSGGLIGEFREGRGELYSQETLGGRSVLIRGIWSDIKPDSHRYEEAYSEDGGKTWVSYFIADLTRARP